MDWATRFSEPPPAKRAPDLNKSDLAVKKLPVCEGVTATPVRTEFGANAQLPDDAVARQRSDTLHAEKTNAPSNPM